MSRLKPLTRTMRAALGLLAEGVEIEDTWHGTYIDGRPAGTIKDGPRVTALTMASLRRRGLVDKDGRGCWTLTGEGREAAGVGAEEPPG